MEKINQVKQVQCKGVKIDIQGNKTICNKKGLNTDETFYKVYTQKEDTNNYVYLCQDCFFKMLEANFKNKLNVNKQAKHNFNYQVELQLSEHDTTFTRILNMNNYVLTSTKKDDIFVTFQSPKYHNLSGIAKMLKSVLNETDETKKDDYFNYKMLSPITINNTDYDNMTDCIINKHKVELFQYMIDWLQFNQKACITLFGTLLQTNSNNFITVKNNNITFNNSKFIDDRQYVDLMTLCTKILKAIQNNFIDKYFETEIKDTRRYKTIEDYREHKLQVTQNKIVMLLEKECDKKNISYVQI